MIRRIKIGLEVHVQLATRSKLFCSCPVAFGAPPNSNTCAICLGLPGALPSLNRSAIELGVRLARGLGSRINRRSAFERKNYFYPDLPKGYQITQYEVPLASGGDLEYGAPSGPRRVAIERVHLEEDSGSLRHVDAPQPASLIDYNRCGVALAEIVTAPELESPHEAMAAFRALRDIAVWLGVSEGNLQRGNLRCDANISLQDSVCDVPGARVELKNLNSFRFLEAGLQHEVERQSAILDRGRAVEQETRGYDAETQGTYPIRSKEDAPDYRYFPEPDLPLLDLVIDRVGGVSAAPPELPLARRSRFCRDYGLSERDAEALTAERGISDYLELLVVDHGVPPQEAAKWILGELTRRIKEDDLSLHAAPVAPAELAALIELVQGGTISVSAAKTVFEEMWVKGGKPMSVVERLGLRRVTKSSSLRLMIAEVLDRNSDAVEDYLSGVDKVFGFLMGKVMEESGGAADPRRTRDLLRQMLQELEEEQT